jgi:hypothetical protein
MQFCRITYIGHRRESRALANNRLDMKPMILALLIIPSIFDIRPAVAVAPSNYARISWPAKRVLFSHAQSCAGLSTSLEEHHQLERGYKKKHSFAASGQGSCRSCLRSVA